MTPLLKEYLYYNPDSGEFRWLKRGNPRFDSRFAGKLAGSKDKDGYLRISLDGKNYQLHRVAWFIAHGYVPMEIDHINRIKDDNRLSNLREVTRSNNMQNIGVRGDNSTGVKGVGWSKSAKKYRARATVNGKRKTIGYSDTIEGAESLIKGLVVSLI